MPETFLILLAGGILLATAVCDPRQVTLHWLRLGGIIALALIALSAFFFARRELNRTTLQIVLYASVAGATLGQLAFVQIDWRKTQRAFAVIAFILATALGVALLTQVAGGMSASTTERVVILAVTSAGISAMTGLVLMDMLLGHAYLTASKMTMAPFARINRTLGVVLGLRAIVSMGGVFLLQWRRPVEMLWPVQGLFIVTRWAVGLALPAVFIYMAHDCIKRRSTQSATGILYVAGLLVFIGELIALSLVTDTTLPF